MEGLTMLSLFGRLYIYQVFSFAKGSNGNPLALPVTVYRSKRNPHFSLTVRTLSQSQTHISLASRGEKVVHNSGSLRSTFAVV